MDSLLVTVVVAVAAILFLRKLIIVVPQQEARVIERLGKYSRTLNAGFYILMPFVDRVSYRHTLKEQSIDIPEQLCITRDNVQVGVDGGALHADSGCGTGFLWYFRLRNGHNPSLPRRP